jgi:PAS domain-containing protein
VTLPVDDLTDDVGLNEERRQKADRGGAHDGQRSLAPVQARLSRTESHGVREQNESIYRTLVEMAKIGYAVIDAGARVVDANAEYIRLSGHQCPEQIRGRCVLDWTVERDSVDKREFCRWITAGRMKRSYP